MATMTLEVPDQLADQLYLEQERLPELLAAALRQRQEPEPLSLPSSLAFGEMVEFLASRPSSQAIQSFKISRYAQERLAVEERAGNCCEYCLIHSDDPVRVDNRRRVMAAGRYPGRR